MEFLEAILLLFTGSSASEGSRVWVRVFFLVIALLAIVGLIILWRINR